MKNKLATIIILLNLLLLAGCGFQLRNTTAIPPQLHKLYLNADTPYGDFEIILRKQLTASGITIVNQACLASFMLHVTSNYSHTDVSSGSSAQGRVYSLYYSATLTLTDSHSKVVLGPSNIAVERNLTLSPNEVFEVSTQVETVKQEMEYELSTKALNILGSPAAFNVSKIKN